MATKREAELLDRVEELEKVHESLMFDLEWLKLSSEKRIAYFLQASKANGKKAGRTQRAKAQGKAQGNGQAKVKAQVERDALGAKPGTKGHMLNAPIISLIEKGKYNLINPQSLSQMSGGVVSKARYADHLNWLKKHNYL